MADIYKKSSVCAIIGNDDPNLKENSQEISIKKNLRLLMIKLITEFNCREFTSGMHRGAEIMGAELAISMRKDYDLKFWGILSSEEQWISWSNAERERFFLLMEQADYEYRAANKKTEDSRSTQLKLIEQEADILIVISSKPSDQINKILSSAVSKRKKVYLLSPVTAEVTPYLQLLV